MEKELSILLIEDDENACNEIQDYVDTLDDVYLTAITNSSFEALSLVKDTLPDAVILDLELHLGGGNGFHFLNGLKELHLVKQPYILITTNNSSTLTFESARMLGADFILAKYESGYSAQYVIDFLRMMRNVILKHSSSSKSSSHLPIESTEQQNRKLTQRIQRELNFVGISPKAVGYRYLTDAILMTIHNSETNLCRKIGEKYKKSDVSIERAMQNAINRAWRTSDPDDLLEHYTARISSERGVPTIMEFVYYYANMLKVEYKF